MQQPAIAYVFMPPHLRLPTHQEGFDRVARDTIPTRLMNGGRMVQLRNLCQSRGARTWHTAVACSHPCGAGETLSFEINAMPLLHAMAMGMAKRGLLRVGLR